MDLEILILLGINEGTDDIGRQEVRGKLDTAELGIDRLRESINRESLGKARDSLEKDMSISEKTDQEIVNEVFLADNDLSHLDRKKVNERAFPFDALIELLDVYTFHIFN